MSDKERKEMTEEFKKKILSDNDNLKDDNDTNDTSKSDEDIAPPVKSGKQKGRNGKNGKKKDVVIELEDKPSRRNSSNAYTSDEPLDQVDEILNDDDDDYLRDKDLHDKIFKKDITFWIVLMLIGFSNILSILLYLLINIMVADKVYGDDLVRLIATSTINSIIILTSVYIIIIPVVFIRVCKCIKK